MSNKPRGLGRGLGDLLADNAPEVRASTVIRRDGNGEVVVSHTASEGAIRPNRANSLSEDEVERTLVFPAVTPMVGGASARAAATEAVEEIDETREILEADAAISGRPSQVSVGGNDVESDTKSEEDPEKKPEETVVYPRSLKAVFRSFK